METEYSVQAEMTFDNEADRDTWHTAIKTAVINAKPTKPTFKTAMMRKSEYAIFKELAVESILPE